MKSRLGISILLLGFVICVFSPFYFMFIGIPSFIIGSLLVWFSDMKTTHKILWSLLPIILWYPLSALFINYHRHISMENAQKKDFYINYDFKGTVTVIESKCGNDPIIKDDRLQFEIPENGIYLFNGELKAGYVDERIFQRYADGNLSTLQDIHSQFINEGMDTTGKEKIIGTSAGAFGRRHNNIDYITFKIVTNKMYSDNELSNWDRVQDRLIDSLIINCK